MSEITVDAIKKFNMTELRSELHKRGLSVNGKKGRVIERLTEAIRETYHKGTDSNMVNEPDMLANKKNLTRLIKKIPKKEFGKQEENIRSLINGYFKITMKEIRKSKDEIKDDRKEMI